MRNTVGIFAVDCNDISDDEFSPTCCLYFSIAEDRLCGDQLLHDTAARNSSRKFEELVEPDRVCVNLNVCQCVLTGVTT